LSPLVSVTDATFEREVLKSELPVLVDFWAPWCSTCEVYEGTLRRISRSFHGRLRVLKINVSENTKTSDFYGVRGLPVTALFIEGKLTQKWVGVTDLRDLEIALRKWLPASKSSNKSARP